MSVAAEATAAPSAEAEITELRERAERAEAEVRFWEGVAEKEVHPLRLRILRTLRDDLPQASPNSLSKLYQLPLGNVSYHAKRLRELGFVEVFKEVPRRGAMEHIMRVTKKARRRR